MCNNYAIKSHRRITMSKKAGFDPTRQADGPGGRAPPWSTMVHCTAPWHLPGGFLLLEPRLPMGPPKGFRSSPAGTSGKTGDFDTSNLDLD